MSTIAFHVYQFNVEYYDPQAELVRSYLLKFFSEDETVEMVNSTNNRRFLKKSKCPGFRLQDVYVGNVISVYSRQLKVVGYGDATTQGLCETATHTAAVILPPRYLHLMGELLALAANHHLTPQNLKIGHASPKAMLDFFRIVGKNHDNGCGNVKCGFMVLSGKAAVARTVEILSKLCGQESLSDGGIHVSESSGSGVVEADFLFGKHGVVPTFPCSPVITGASLCVVRPAAVLRGLAGPIWAEIETAGLQITAATMLHLSPTDAADFLEVYKGVVPNHQAIVNSLTEGPLVALEVCNVSGGSAVGQLRELAGPSDPELARVLRPASLHAKFGQDAIANAVHVTDLEEDGPLESEFFFALGL